MAALHTTKFSLRTPVRSRPMPARMARLARVGRVDHAHGHAGHLRLVGDTGAKLREGPIAVSCSLRWPRNPRPLANMGQFLKPNRPLRAFCLRNQFLADPVVHVSLIPTLPSRHLAQATLGRLRTNRLQRLLAPRVPLPLALYVLAGIGFTVTIGRKVDDAQVYPKHVVNFLLGRFGNIAGRKHVPRAFAVDQIALAVLVRKEGALPFAGQERDRQPPVEGPNGHLARRQGPRQDPVVIGNAAMSPEGAHGRGVELVGISDLRDHADRQLRRQPVGCTNAQVAQLLQVKLLEGARIPRKRTYRVTRRVRRLKGAQQGVCLRGGGGEFDLCDELHSKKYITTSKERSSDDNQEPDSRRVYPRCDSSVRRARVSSARATALRLPRGSFSGNYSLVRKLRPLVFYRHVT